MSEPHYHDTGGPGGTCVRCAEEREAPRCATCGGKGVVLRTVGDADSGPSHEYDPCPTCSPRSETDGGLLGALRRGRARDEDAALIDELRAHLEAWRDARSDVFTDAASVDLLRHLDGAVQ